VDELIEMKKSIVYTLDLSLTPASFKPRVEPNNPWGKQTVEEYSKQYWLSKQVAMMQVGLPELMMTNVSSAHTHTLSHMHAH
jgi:hypothetical protein